MTHTTREVKETDVLWWREQILYKVLKSGHDMSIDDADFIARYIVIPFNQEHHQELQKAREIAFKEGEVAGLERAQKIAIESMPDIKIEL